MRAGGCSWPSPRSSIVRVSCWVEAAESSAGVVFGWTRASGTREDFNSFTTKHTEETRNAPCTSDAPLLQQRFRGGVGRHHHFDVDRIEESGAATERSVFFSCVPWFIYSERG